MPWSLEEAGEYRMDREGTIGLITYLGVIGLAYAYLPSSIFIPILGDVNVFLILTLSTLAGVIGLIYTLVREPRE